MLPTLLALVRQIPARAEAAIVAWCDRLVVAAHRPVDVGLDTARPWCLRCKEPWPCAALCEQDRRMMQRTGDKP